MTSNKEIIISRFAKDHLTDVYTISNDQFGFDYITWYEFEKYISDPDYYCFAAFAGGKLAGFSIIKVTGFTELSENLKSIAPPLIKPFEKYFPVGFRKHTAVDPKYENTGIGTALAGYSIKILKGKIRSMVSVVWENSPSSIERILLSFGFSEIHIQPGFWGEESLRKGYKCKVCGNPPCKCTAKILGYFYPEN